jgi:NAD(P)-dependent dehydrogenase (short-subunit alcohol dehydrogenase family)
MVTGATSGIGAVTALELARLGGRVVIVGRSPERCEATVARIRQATGNPDVEYLLADLSSQAQIRSLARQFPEKYERLDVLVNNAGGVFLHRRVTVDGYEMTFALNHLNYFLLTLLLLDWLKASAPARIVNVASNSHRGKRLDFDDLQGEKRYNGMRAYGQSKLANVLFTYELARRLEGSGVTANALHPGFVYTEIWDTLNPWLRPLVAGVIRLVALPPEEGAKTSIYLATSPEVEGVNGKYFTLQKQVTSDPASYDEAAARLLWERSLQMVGLA